MDESNAHVKASELLNKKVVFQSSLIRPISKLLVLTSRSQFRLYEDPDGGNW